MIKPGNTVKTIGNSAAMREETAFRKT